MIAKLIDKVSTRNQWDKKTERQKLSVASGTVGIVCNLLLFAFKFLAGTLTGSIAITADAFNNLADSGKDLERALALIQRAAELEPEADFIIDSLAWAHFRLGHVDEAWLHIQRAVGLNENAPRDPSMLEHFGDIAHTQGDDKGARLAYEASLEIFLKHFVFLL